MGVDLAYGNSPGLAVPGLQSGLRAFDAHLYALRAEEDRDYRRNEDGE